MFLYPLQWKKGEVRYTDREWTAEEVAAFEDGILLHGPELRAVRDEVGTRTVPEVVRFYGHWKKYVSKFTVPIYFFFTLDASSMLKEEHIRTRERAAVVKETDETEPTVEVHMSDDEGSTIRGPIKANTSCGACRTRESDTWWRAPKGLATDLLCETCGTNWRKYADLNVRPLREEIFPPGKKSAEKREGTPLSAPNAKRLRVWSFVERFSLD